MTFCPSGTTRSLPICEIIIAPALIEGTGGARKVRFAGKGKGKSGGYRVITFFTGTDIPVFLLNIFSKNEKTDLTPKERRVLKTILAEMVKAYRPTRESR